MASRHFGKQASRPGRRSGLSLIESVISTMLVGVVLVAALKTVGATAQSRKMLVQQRQVMDLGQQLLAEILQASYQDPDSTPVFGPESGEGTTTRAAFDDVDDYHGRSEFPPEAKDGTLLTDFTGWRRQVVVAFVDPSNPQNSSSDQGLKRVTVTVTNPQGRQTLFVGLRAASGLGEQKPVSATTYVTWAGVDITTSAAASPTRTATNLVNQPVAN